MSGKRGKIELLSVLGQMFEAYKSILQMVFNVSVSTELAERMTSDEELIEDFASILLGYSIALPIHRTREKSKRGDKKFTCLYAGDYLVAIAEGWDEEENAPTAKNWLRIGDKVETACYGLVEITRIESPADTRKVRLHGYDFTESDNCKQRNFSFNFEDIRCEHRKPRQHETWVTGLNECQLARRTGKSFLRG